MSFSKAVGEAAQLHAHGHYTACGINGCILETRHAGSCLFNFNMDRAARARMPPAPRKAEAEETLPLCSSGSAKKTRATADTTSARSLAAAKSIEDLQTVYQEGLVTWRLSLDRFCPTGYDSVLKIGRGETPYVAMDVCTGQEIGRFPSALDAAIAVAKQRTNRGRDSRIAKRQKVLEALADSARDAAAAAEQAADDDDDEVQIMGEKTRAQLDADGAANAVSVDEAEEEEAMVEAEEEEVAGTAAEAEDEGESAVPLEASAVASFTATSNSKPSAAAQPSVSSQPSAAQPKPTEVLTQVELGIFEQAAAGAIIPRCAALEEQLFEQPYTPPALLKERIFAIHAKAVEDGYVE